MKLNERGSIGGVEGMAFGILVFVFGTLMVTNAWAVVDAKLATGAAAREAARVYVESSSRSEANVAAQQAADDVIQGHGRAKASVQVSSGSFQRCGQVDMRVSTTIARVRLPLIGGSGGNTVVSSVHTEVIDPYRSGLVGTAQC